jgi:ketosteroid isomerase-like protein
MSEANIAIVQGLSGAYGRGDIDTVLDGCLADVEWFSGGRKEDFPGFGPRKGKAEVRDFFATVSDALTFDTFTPREFYADRDKVFALGHYAGTMKTGSKVASEWIHVFTFHEGRIAKFREFADTAAFVEAYRG